jgi:hypothetical protein
MGRICEIQGDLTLATLGIVGDDGKSAFAPGDLADHHPPIDADIAREEEAQRCHAQRIGLDGLEPGVDHRDAMAVRGDHQARGGIVFEPGPARPLEVEGSGLLHAPGVGLDESALGARKTHQIGPGPRHQGDVVVRG